MKKINIQVKNRHKRSWPLMGLVTVLAFTWIFSGWPQIFNFPPKIQFAQALTAGPNYAGAVGTNSFTLPANAVGSVETDCTDDYDAVLQSGFWNTFGFAIPAGDTIDGIQVEVKWAYNSDPPVAGGNGITVVKSEASLGTEQTFVTAEPTGSTACGATQEIDTKGGVADKWGFASWTPAEVNATTFGVRIRKSITGNEDGLNINWIRVTVTHTAGAATTFNQSAYRMFNNLNSADVGTALAAQDTAATLGSTGAAFRLRQLIHVAGANLAINGETFKLQFAQQSGTCDTGFVGETYADVTAATVIAYNDNATPLDGDNLTANANDPTHAADTIVNQDYEELNNFTNSVAAIPLGQDGKWDFSLKDNGATASTAYCLRAVLSTGTVLNTYTVIPQITTAAPAQTITFSLGANSVNLGTLSSGAVSTGSHTIIVGTNAANGVVVTYSGSTLTSGTNTITAMSTAAASSVGTEQFGINSKLNTTPAVGAECSGTTPIAAAATGYSTVDNFKFVSGETVVSSAGSINDTTCTISYIANISAPTEAGTYNSTLTFIATGTF